MEADHLDAFTTACDTYLDRQHAFVASLLSIGAVSSNAAVGLRARLDQVGAEMHRTRNVLRASPIHAVPGPGEVDPVESVAANTRRPA